jgi:hypothetical protein
MGWTHSASVTVAAGAFLQNHQVQPRMRASASRAASWQLQRDSFVQHVLLLLRAWVHSDMECMHMKQQH